jgi:transcriptional regulator with XRE-family HTH domain
MQIGEKIRKKRKEKGLRQEDLALTIGITKKTLGLYERGERNPSAELAKKIAEALEIKDLNWLFAAGGSIFGELKSGQKGEDQNVDEFGELIGMVAAVLNSSSIHRQSLINNIRSFSKAVEDEKKIAELEALRPTEFGQEGGG